ncbi:MAG: hypothetical protein MUE73_06890, partial [Planctomycetes bacterium]|nr:hypothetical protein [Planctomycetota bacterium]
MGRDAGRSGGPAGCRWPALLAVLLPLAAAFASPAPMEPFATVDDLLAAGNAEEAAAVAGQYRGPGAEALRRYVAGPPAEDPEARRAFRDAQRLADRAEHRAALVRLEGTAAPGDSVLATRIHLLRGALLYAEGRDG